MSEREEERQRKERREEESNNIPLPSISLNTKSPRERMWSGKGKENEWANHEKKGALTFL